MPVDAHEEAGNLLRIIVQGRLTPADQAVLVYGIGKAVQRQKQVRLLIVLEDFAGWTVDESWGDDALRLESDASVIKAAFVGETRWKDEVLAFVGKPFRAIPIEYFTSEDAARAWLAT